MRPWSPLLIAAILLAPVVASPFGPPRGDLPTRLAQAWDDLTTEQKTRAIENYQRYKSLPPEKQHDVEERYRRWKNLPSADKDRYRKQYQDRGDR